MSERLKYELKKLNSQGVSAGDLTADEISSLVHACDRVNNPFDGINREAVGIPVHVGGNVYFWQLTIGASMWLDEVRQWFKDEPTLFYWAFVYALIHAREKGAFEGLRDVDATLQAIKAEIRRLPVTREEVDLAVDKCLCVGDCGDCGDGEETQAEKNKRKLAEEQGVNWSDLVIRLEAQTGIERDSWVWDRSSRYALRSYESLFEFACAAQGASVGRQKDELDAAISALARLEVEIVGRVNAERSNEK